MSCDKNCNNDCNCENPILSPSVLYDTNDCGTCGGLNTYWTMENFYRSVLRQKITATQLPPFNVNVNKLPYGMRGLMTLSPNTDIEEVVEYMYETGTPGNPGEITILKRGIHPAALNLVVDGVGGNSITIDVDGTDVLVAPEFNNCDYMFEHLTNSEVQRDVTAQDFNIFSRFTCCVPATMSSLGIVALSVPADNPEFPIAVGINDYANCDKNRGILRGLTKCVPNGEEIAVSWNDYATHDRAGLTKIKNLEVESMQCGAGSISTTTWNGTIAERAMHSEQRAFASVFGAVRLSKSHPESVALSALDFAGNLNPGIVRIKEANTNPTCSEQAHDDNQECPVSVKEVIQKNDFANTLESGLVYLSKELNNNFPCPVVVTKHDFATKDNTGIVRVEDYCPVGDGYAIVPSMCTYANNDKLGLTYLTVDTEDCNNTNIDAPSLDNPIATSTTDKRNFRQLCKYSRNFTDDGAGPGLLIDSSNINAVIVEIPFNGGGYPGTGFVTTNTGDQALYDTNDINKGDFYCYGDMVEPGTDYSRIIIQETGYYHVSANVTIRNTKTQLEDAALGTNTTVTYSMRIKTNSALFGGNPAGESIEVSDLNVMMTTAGDGGYQPADPRYGDSIRTVTMDDSDFIPLNAGDELWLSLSTDQIDCYLIYAAMSVFCIQPAIS